MSKLKLENKNVKLTEKKKKNPDELKKKKKKEIGQHRRMETDEIKKTKINQIVLKIEHNFHISNSNTL